MAQAIMDPEKVRRFADELQRFNTDLENRLVLLQARFGALSDCHSEAELLEVLKDYLGRYAKETHVSTDYRIWQKRRSLELL